MLMLSVGAGIRERKIEQEVCWRLAVNEKQQQQQQKEKNRKTMIVKRKHHSLRSETQYLPSAPVFFFKLRFLLNHWFKPKVVY